MNEEKNIHTNSFDDAIKNKLYDYEMHPSGALWGNIENAIQKDIPVEKKKDSSKYFLLLLAFISLIGISASSSYYILNNETAKKATSTKNIDSNKFALNYNRANTSYPTTQNSMNKSLSNSSSKDKYVIDRVYVSNDNTKHIFLSTIPQEKLEISTIATNNRISNYKEIPTMLLSGLNNSQASIAFNNLHQEEEPIFIKSKPLAKGFYIGTQAQTGVNMIPKNNNQNNILGNNISFTPNVYYKAGVVLGYNVHKNVAIESGINYINRQFKYTSQLYDAVSKGQVKLSYVEVPLVVKYKSNWVDAKNHQNSVNIYTGVSYAYLVRAEAKIDSKKLVHYSNQNYNAKEYIPNHNLCFKAGIEYQFYVRKNLALSFGAEANYSGSAKAIKTWNDKSTNAFTNVGVGVNTTITFSTKKSIK